MPVPVVQTDVISAETCSRLSLVGPSPWVLPLGAGPRWAGVDADKTSPRRRPSVVTLSILPPFRSITKAPPRPPTAGGESRIVHIWYEKGPKSIKSHRSCMKKRALGPIRAPCGSRMYKYAQIRQVRAPCGPRMHKDDNSGPSVGPRMHKYDNSGPSVGPRMHGAPMCADRYRASALSRKEKRKMNTFRPNFRDR